MRIEVVTLFPEFVGQAVRVGVLGRAIEAGRVAVHGISVAAHGSKFLSHSTAEAYAFQGRAQRECF